MNADKLRRYIKFSELTKEWLDSIPKTINANGCWIPINKPTGAGYVPIQIEGVSYLIHRLVVSAYYNLEYDDHSWDTRHNNGCDTRCFFHDHLKPGTVSDNMKDRIRDGTNFNSNKEICPKCGGIYTIKVQKTGWDRGRISRRCKACDNMSNWRRQFK